MRHVRTRTHYENMNHAKSRGGAELSDTIFPVGCVAAGAEGPNIHLTVLHLRSCSVLHHHQLVLQTRHFSSDKGSCDSEPGTLFHKREEKAEYASGFM